MALPNGIIRSFKENEVSGLCFCLADMLAFVPQAVGGCSAHIVAVLVIDPADVAAAIEAGLRGGTAPDVGSADIFLRFLVNRSKFFIGQGFSRNRIVDARFAGTIRTACGQAILEQIRTATLGILKNLVTFPLIFRQFLTDNHLQSTVFQFGVEDFIFVGHLYGIGHQGKGVDHYHCAVTSLHFHPCSQLVLLFENFVQLCLYFAAGVVVIQGGQERGELPRVMCNFVQMVLVFVIAGMICWSALDFLVQLLLQFLVVGFCALDVPVLGGVDGLPGHLRGATEQDGAGRECRHHQHQKQKKNAHNPENVRIALCKIGNAVDGSADSRLALINDLLHAGPCCRGAAGCRLLPTSGLRCSAARPGSGVVTFTNLLFLPPPGKPVGAALAGAGCVYILCRSRLPCRRFCGFGAFFALHLGFLFQLPGIAAFGNIPDIASLFFALTQSLRAHIVVLVLVNLPVHRRPGNGCRIHLPFLCFCHAGCFVRGDLDLAEAQVLCLFLDFVGIQFQLLLLERCLLDTLLFRRGACGSALLILLKFQLRLFLIHALPPPLQKGG